jgi:hypothetical protein
VRAPPAILGLALAAAACTAAPESPAPRGEAQQVATGRTTDRPAPCQQLGRLVARIRRGYVPFASPDLMLIPRAPNYLGSPSVPPHSGPWDYLARVPLVFFGPGIVASSGPLPARATTADIAPTLASLVGFDGFPERAGRLLPGVRRPGPAPRLVVVIVWDGGGWNALRRHPHAWPNLRTMGRRGASFPRAVIGSSPSVTAPVHATLGTGAWPRTHGIPALNVRTRADDYVDPLLYLDPGALRISTLADLYDAAKANRPVAGMLASSNWHLGMIGHGASHPGGDRDPVVDSVRLRTLTESLDRSDGRLDGRWRAYSLEEDLFVKKGNPARVAYEQHLLERLVRVAGFGADNVPDLLFVNFKASDEAGHRWGLHSRQVGEVIAAQDRALGRLVTFLDHRVGPRRWALVVTADHGQMPHPQRSGAWPIAGGELLRDINARFDDDGDDTDVAGRVVSSGVYLHRSEVAERGLRPGAIARWIGNYTVAENAQGPVPSGWGTRRDEPLFEAVLVHRRVAARSCSQARP